MKEFIIYNLQWFLIISIFLTRIIDIVTTYIVTPRLILETNPLVRKYKWPSAVFTIVLALLPFASINLGIVILTLSLISSSLNIRK
ncbi:MAG: hypothetical protein JXA06_13780, partial [Bacteroidetes bacterium]|nr:hypothetical protein [Bacteroidota bacterium]